MRDGEIYARGAADDKGQVFMHLKAIEAHLKNGGTLPVNLKLIIEGEEEVGSANLDDFVKSNKAQLVGRRRRDLGLGDVRSRRAVDLLLAARAGLLPDRSARHQERPALGRVRRRRRQSQHGAGADPGADEGPRRPDQDSRLLRGRQAAVGRGAGSLEEAAVQREEIPQGARRAEALRRVRLHDARARLGEADVRGERPAGRVYRRGREDGDSGGVDGQGQHAPRAGSGSRRRSASCSRTTCARSRRSPSR